MSEIEASPSRRSPSQLNAPWTLAMVAVFSAISKPREEARAWFDAAPEPVTLALIHVAPVLVALAALVAERLINRGRVGALSVLIVAALSAVVGFVFVLLLDLAGRIIDPSWFVGDIGWPEAAGLVVGVGFFAIGVFATIGALVASSADLSARDRRLSAVGAPIYVLEGAAIVALTVARLLPERSPESVIVITLALVAAGAAAALTGLIWRLMDEVERRATLDAYAVSFFVGFYAILGWVGLEALGRAPEMTAYGALIAASGFSFLASVWMTIARFGRSIFA